MSLVDEIVAKLKRMDGIQQSAFMKQITGEKQLYDALLKAGLDEKNNSLTDSTGREKAVTRPNDVLSTETKLEQVENPPLVAAKTRILPNALFEYDDATYDFGAWVNGTDYAFANFNSSPPFNVAKRVLRLLTITCGFAYYFDNPLDPKKVGEVAVLTRGAGSNAGQIEIDYLFDYFETNYVADYPSIPVSADFKKVSFPLPITVISGLPKLKGVNMLGFTLYSKTGNEVQLAKIYFGVTP